MPLSASLWWRGFRRSAAAASHTSSFASKPRRQLPNGGKHSSNKSRETCIALIDLAMIIMEDPK